MILAATLPNPCKPCIHSRQHHNATVIPRLSFCGQMGSMAWCVKRAAELLHSDYTSWLHLIVGTLSFTGHKRWDWGKVGRSVETSRKGVFYLYLLSQSRAGLLSRKEDKLYEEMTGCSGREAGEQNHSSALRTVTHMQVQGNMRRQVRVVPLPKPWTGWAVQWQLLTGSSNLFADGKLKRAYVFVAALQTEAMHGAE